MSGEKKLLLPVFVSGNLKVRYRSRRNHAAPFPQISAGSNRIGHSSERRHRALVAQSSGGTAGAPVGSDDAFCSSRAERFVSLKDGAVTLEKILIPVDRDPDPQTALNSALLLARGLGCGSGELRLLHIGVEETTPMLDLPQNSLGL